MPTPPQVRRAVEGLRRAVLSLPPEDRKQVIDAINALIRAIEGEANRIARQIGVPPWTDVPPWIDPMRGGRGGGRPRRSRR